MVVEDEEVDDLGVVVVELVDFVDVVEAVFAVDAADAVEEAVLTEGAEEAEVIGGIIVDGVRIGEVVCEISSFLI